MISFVDTLPSFSVLQKEIVDYIDGADGNPNFVNAQGKILLPKDDFRSADLRLIINIDKKTATNSPSKQGAVTFQISARLDNGQYTDEIDSSWGIISLSYNTFNTLNQNVFSSKIIDPLLNHISSWGGQSNRGLADIFKQVGIDPIPKNEDFNTLVSDIFKAIGSDNKEGYTKQTVESVLEYGMDFDMRNLAKTIEKGLSDDGSQIDFNRLKKPFMTYIDTILKTAKSQMNLNANSNDDEELIKTVKKEFERSAEGFVSVADKKSELFKKAKSRMENFENQTNIEDLRVFKFFDNAYKEGQEVFADAINVLLSDSENSTETAYNTIKAKIDAF